MVVLSCALAACTGHSRAAESRAVIPLDPGDLEGSAWILVAIGEFDGVPASTPLTLNVGDGRASGSGPCNRYNVAFVYEGNDLTTGRVASTRMACASRLMRAEERYFRAIERADTIEKESDRLVLSGSDDDDRLVFAPAEVAREIVGEWDVVNVAAESAIVSVLRGTSPTLDFDSDGTVAIDTGCNTGRSSWSAEEQSLEIDPPRLTLRTCDEPPGVMEQEANIVAALDRTRSAEIAGARASLVDGDGAIVLVLARSP
jgi:heat shock protein HslJ